MLSAAAILNVNGGVAYGLRMGSFEMMLFNMVPQA
jgi:hypothetical protein